MTDALLLALATPRRELVTPLRLEHASPTRGPAQYYGY